MMLSIAPSNWQFLSVPSLIDLQA
eukprot:COSAG06_NODE_55834_length_287_cov_1.648936_2_plen_23_part_01